METYRTGEGPAAIWNYKGTLAEIRAVQGPEGSLGHPTDSRLELRYRNGAWEALENGAVNLDTGAEQVPGAVVAPNILSMPRSGPLQSFDLGLTYMGIQIRPGATPATATDAYIDNGAPYYDEATKLFYLLYVGVSQSGGNPGTESIHLAKATAVGGPWTKLGQIIQPSGVNGDPDEGGCTGASEPIWDADTGLYYVYYIGTDEVGYEQGNKTICLATAPAITGPYTKRGAKLSGYGSSALTPGAVWHRSIVKHDDGSWHMFFNASAASGEYILHATAPGVAGPWTIDTSGVLLDRGAGKWDSLYVADPSVLRVGDMYIMSYWGGSSSANADIGAGMAWTTKEAFPYGWQKLSVDAPWFNSTTFKTYQNQTLATKPRLLRVGAELYVFWSSNISTTGNNTGSGVYVCRVGSPAKGVFPRSRNGQSAYGGPGYNEFGLQVGDYLPLGLADLSAVALVAATDANSYLCMGQAFNINLLIGWIYNATTGNAYALIDTYGSTNSIRIGAAMGTAGKAGISVGDAATPGARSLVDFNSTAKGVRLPRMTTTQRDAVSWVAGYEGMEIYNSTLKKKQVWTGTAWETVTSA